MRLNGKTAVITGAGSGMGKAMAEAEPVFTIAPPPVFSMEMMPYFIPKKTPRRLTE